MVSQPSLCNTGVMSSDFFVLVNTRPVRFCLSCSLWRFSLEVPDHTVERYNSWLNTRGLRIRHSTSLENKCRTLFIRS